MRNLSLNALALALLAVGSGPAIAGMTCQASSPAHRVALVELYTSEGCSSCPPADQWLSALSSSALSADKVLPLALHVDYWDYIGWKDRFAEPAYTKRQRGHAARNRLNSIYTPQVVTNGQDTRDWYRAGSFLSRVEAISSQPSPVTMQLQASQTRPGSATVTVGVDVQDASALSAGPATVHVVMYQNGLASEVSRGENAGRHLVHDRVVRHWARPQPMKSALSFEREIELPWNAVSDSAAGTGLAAFVQASDGEVIQAVDCVLAAPASTS